MLADPGERPLLREAERGDIELDEVRLDELEVDRQPRVGPALREPAGAGVVVGEPVEVVAEPRFATDGPPDPPQPAAASASGTTTSAMSAFLGFIVDRLLVRASWPPGKRIAPAR